VAFNDMVDRLDVGLGPWDSLSLPASSRVSFISTGAADALALLVVQGDGPKRPQFDATVHSQAAALDRTLDAGGHLARKSLLPPAMPL
jgi:hypothetical protein